MQKYPGDRFFHSNRLKDMYWSSTVSFAPTLKGCHVRTSVLGLKTLGQSPIEGLSFPNSTSAATHSSRVKKSPTQIRRIRDPIRR